MISTYLLIPIVAWLAGGTTKFIINSIRARQLAFKMVGYGGLPSNHATIVTATASYLFFKNTSSEALLVAITLGFIVCIDALGLRKHIAKQATAINALGKLSEQNFTLRERVGHKPIEIGAGILLGTAVGYLSHCILH